MYFAKFSVDKSLLDDAHELHFDLYSESVRNGDRDISKFAPFSHDAGTVGPPVRNNFEREVHSLGTI